MRTTLNIDDDVLQAAKELGRCEKKTIGQTLSELARKALTGTKPTPAAPSKPEAPSGFKPFSSRGGVVTNELINQLREEEIY